MQRRRLNHRKSAHALFDCDRSNVVVRKDGDVPTIDLFGVIFDDEWEGLTPKNLAEALDDIGNVSELRLRINSPGGVITGANSMYNMLKQHPAKITAEVIGEAASAAGYLFQVADVRRMHENSMLMVHNAITGIWGNKHEFRKEAQVLDKLDSQITSVFVKRSGKSAAEITALLDAETWLTANESIDIGLADDVVANKQEGNPPSMLGVYCRELALAAAV